MKKIGVALVILGFIVLGITAYYYSEMQRIAAIEIKEPEWQDYVLDNKTAKRFVSLSVDEEDNPHIFYFAERGEGGVNYFHTNTNIRDFPNEGRRWLEKKLNEGESLGFFVSSAFDNEGNIHLCYQDYTVGDEKLYYGLVKNDSFDFKIIDDVSKSGMSAGMYCSISLVRGVPYVIYHVEQGKKLMIQNIETGEIKELERGTGWSIQTVSDQNKIHVAYRGRGDMHLRYGVYDTSSGNWQSFEYPVNVSSVDIALWQGEPYMAYYNEDDNGIYFTQTKNFKPVKAAEGYLSRVSMSINNGSIYLLYPKKNGGLFLAESKDGRNFEEQKIIDRKDAGEYNDLYITDNGDIKMAYLDDGAVGYKEYEVSSYVYYTRVKEENLRGANQHFSFSLYLGLTLLVVGLVMLFMRHK